MVAEVDLFREVSTALCREDLSGLAWIPLEGREAYFLVPRAVCCLRTARGTFQGSLFISPTGGVSRISALLVGRFS